MSTLKTATFSDMLNEYLVYSNILEETFRDQNWLLKTANMVKTWQGGKLIVPFQQSYASSVNMGSLAADADIDSATYIRGSLDGYKECYGSLFFNSRDLHLDHFKISEQNFLRLLPDQLEQLMRFMKQTVSIQVLNSAIFDSVTAAPVSAVGIMDINSPERYMIGMKVALEDADTNGDVYIIGIDKNASTITVSETRGGAVYNMSAAGYDADTNVYIAGANPSAAGGQTNFGSLKDMLLPLAAGGSDNFAGKVKLDSPFAQAVTYDVGGVAGDANSDWGATPLTGNGMLTMIFDALRKGHQLAAEPDCFVMSYTNYSAALLAVEKNSGAFKNIKPAIDYAGYSSITVGGLHGAVELVAVREMGDDWIAGIKKSYLDFHCGNKPFKVITSPDGLKYYTKRATTGYTYITDICFVGDFLYRHPHSGIGIYNIPPISLPAIT